MITVEPHHIKVLKLWVIPIFNSDTMIFPSSKAILATQFDAFEKGRQRQGIIVEKSPINENLRVQVPLPI